MSISSISFTQQHMLYYRLMGTKQCCKRCGTRRNGNVAEEPYVVYELTNALGQKVIGSIKRSELLRRYAYYNRCAPEEATKYLPALPCRVVWIEHEIPQCPQCFKGEVPQTKDTMPNMVPADPELVRNNPHHYNNPPAELKDRKKAKPKPAPFTLSKLAMALGRSS